MFQWEIKENPKWKNMLLRGGKNNSEFLNSCNEDNLIKIKAKLIKNLKVQVFGCIISLKHGRMGLLSLVEFLVMQTGDASGSQWNCTAGLQFCDHSFWPFCSLLVFLLFGFWEKKKYYFDRKFPSSYEFFFWECNWGQSSCCLSVYRFYSWISWFIPWSNHSQVEKKPKTKHAYTHIPLVCVSSLKMERELKILAFFFFFFFIWNRVKIFFKCKI